MKARVSDKASLLAKEHYVTTQWTRVRSVETCHMKVYPILKDNSKVGGCLDSVILSGIDYCTVCWHGVRRRVQGHVLVDATRWMPHDWGMGWLCYACIADPGTQVLEVLLRVLRATSRVLGVLDRLVGVLHGV